MRPFGLGPALHRGWRHAIIRRPPPANGRRGLKGRRRRGRRERSSACVIGTARFNGQTSPHPGVSPGRADRSARALQDPSRRRWRLPTARLDTRGALEGLDAGPCAGCGRPHDWLRRRLRGLGRLHGPARPQGRDGLGRNPESHRDGSGQPPRRSAGARRCGGHRRRRSIEDREVLDGREAVLGRSRGVAGLAAWRSIPRSAGRQVRIVLRAGRRLAGLEGLDQQSCPLDGGLSGRRALHARDRRDQGHPSLASRPPQARGASRAARSRRDRGGESSRAVLPGPGTERGEGPRSSLRRAVLRIRHAAVELVQARRRCDVSRERLRPRA